MKITSCLFGLFFLVLSQPALSAPEVLRDIAYDDEHEAQVLDVYRVESKEPSPVMLYIHGGGWRAGSKNRIPGFLARGVEEGIYSVVSVEYRFTDVAVHPAQVNDCVRAIQFVRSKAKKWNLDPDRIGVTGGSAGAHLSLWIALHDELANPESEDPVERESSRVSCAIGFAGPTDWSLLSELRHDHPAYRQLLGYEPGTPAEKMEEAKMKSVSPITFVSKEDPPILIVHGDADVIVPVQHAHALNEQLNAAGADVELHLVKGGNHGVAGAGEAGSVERANSFLKEHLLGRPTPTGVAIIVGPEKHAPGTHEVAAGGRLIAHCLNEAENVDGIRARVFYEWPEDPDLMKSVDTVVFIGDQFPAERLDGSDRAMSDLEAMTARGCGIVCVHYATGLGVEDVAEDGDHPLLHWTGGYFATRCNHHQSVARIFEATITPTAPEDHPIRRGWAAFDVRDEPYTRNWFGRDGLAEGAISLATVEFPPDDPKTETVAWAIERKDGGRGAGITMPHFFRNWEKEELRRFILNTIVWTSGGDVPANGVESSLPDLKTFEPVSVDPRPKLRLQKATQ
ncbi:MAG: alpha/beta hydrolase [Verrucomicrobiales bacterium]|nr:alpha/beta hydrolase [Verrucomicrobiales bacterium]